MFYSQFILAKKGPLGTIWIAAHLERKLRKNQVADTDIGVSVDSILFPDVPIALRLSSHLLLGVVRIYSRKVNYLFDDCSEALLKVKQAFRSTAVDLPPEESTAPYHSITLPETFDLDDFELPDSENFHGNYDHHVSAREQITLQDSMEGVVYSTSQFGLDERFGDEDTSGLDLDEELFLSKATAPGPAEVMRVSDPDHESTQPLTPFELGKDVEDAHDDIEAADHGGDDDPMDYAHAPSTPGLVEEPNFSKVQGAGCDDHLDLADDPNLTNVQETAGTDRMALEDLNLCAVEENMGSIAQSSDLHHGMQNAVNAPLPTDTDAVSVFVDQEIKLKSGEVIPSDAGNELRSAEEGLFSNNGPDTFSVGEANADRGETRGVGSDDIVVCPPSSHEAHVSEDPFGNTSVTEDISKKSCYENVPEGLSDGYHDAQGPEVSNNIVDARGEELLHSVSSVLASDIEVSGVVEFEDPETQACKEPNDASTLNTTVPKGLAFGDMHILHRCNDLDQPSSVNNGCDVSYKEPNDSSTLNTIVPKELAFGDMHILHRCNDLDQPSSVNNGCDVFGSHEFPSGANGPWGMDTSGIKEVSDAPEASIVVQGEGCPATDFVAPVTEDYQTSEPVSQKDIWVDSMLSRDTLSKHLHSSETSELPAVEKLLSVPEGFANPQNNILEFTPANTLSGTANGGDAWFGATSGIKRSFAESSLTVQSIDSVGSFEAARSKRAKESVPGDDDLLSSILVGRKSSVLKVKATPPVQQTVRAKRPRSAPRPSASKRKVIMDDTMVLHGDVIRQQLTNTEDIRRVRKKAPCTRSEIWMIQKQMLEDEIFSEPIITGLSAELALLHTQSYDLSRIRLSQDDRQDSVVNAAPELENNPQKATNDFDLSAEPNFDKEFATEGFFESYFVGNDMVAECPDNQETVDHLLEPTGDGCTQPQSLLHKHPALVAEIDCENRSTELNTPTGPVLESNLATDALSGDKSVMAASSMEPPALSNLETNVESSFHIEENPPTGPVPESTFATDAFTGEKLVVADSSVDPPALSNLETSVESSFHIEAPGLPSDQKLDSLFVETEIAGDYISSEQKDSDAVKLTEENEDSSAVGATVSTGREEPPVKEVEDGAAFGFGEDIQTVCNPHVTETNPSDAACAESDRPVDHVDMTLDESLQDMFKDELPTKEVDFLPTELNNAGKVPPSYGSTEEPNFSVVHPEELGGYPEHASVNDGEHPSTLEADPQSTMDAENLASGHAVIEEHNEFGYAMDEHDTGFLNDDDDDIAEEEEFFVPSPDRTADDYSGWSSRTRAVAKYLHVLFDKEPDHEKKTLPMDNLLVGKTRKEASRMFFEALVLKTRDYVHVEQANPFDKINIKPGVKMTKSSF